MSGSEFPLTLLLQVQDDMSSGVDSAKTSVEDFDSAATKASDSTSALQTRVSSGGTDFVKFGLGVAAAAGSIINLIRQYHNLQRAKANVANMQRREENADLTLKNAKDRLKEAIKKHGKNSKEAEKASRAVTKAENAQTSASSRLEQAQISLNDRMTDFAFSIVPSVVGVVAGLAQTFQVLGGGRGIGGLGMGFLKFGGVLAIAGAALLAIKFNFLGARDAVQSLGDQIGNAVPALKPFLNFLQNAGIVFGLLPGDVDKAKASMNGFLKDTAAFGKKAFDQVQQIAQLFLKGDLSGAIDKIKGNLIKVFDITIGDIKINGFTVSQWVHGLPIVIKHLFDTEGPWEAVIDTFKILIKSFIWPDIRPEAKRGLALMKAHIEGIFNNPVSGIQTFNIDFNKLFALTFTDLNKTNMETPLAKWLDSMMVIWDRQLGIALNDMQLNWRKRQLQLQNFIETNPILSGIIDFGKQIIAFLAPLFDLNTWNTAISSFTGTIMKIPVMISNLITSAMNTIGTGVLQVARIINLFVAQIFDLNAWNTAINSFGATALKIGTMIGNIVLGALNSATILASDISKWLETNVFKPFRIEFEKAWNALVDWVNKNIPFAELLNLQKVPVEPITLTVPTVTVIPGSVLYNIDDVPGTLSCGGISGGFQQGCGPLPMAGTLTLAPSEIQVSTANSGPVTLQNVAQTNGSDNGTGGADPLANAQALTTALLNLDAVVTDLTSKFPQLNANFNTLAVVVNQNTINMNAINIAITLFNTQSILLNASLLLMNAQFILLNASMLLFNASMLILNAQILILNAQFLLMNASLLLFNASLIILNAQLLVLITNTTLWVALNNLLAVTLNQLTINVTALIAANNVLAVTINQVTINVLALIKANNVLAVTINQITVNTNAWIKANNTLAQTINQVTVNVNALTKAVSVCAKAIVTMTKDVTSATSAFKSGASAAKSYASSLNSLASAANKAAAAIKKLNAARSSGGGGSTRFAKGGSFVTTGQRHITVGEAGPEFVSVTPLGNKPAMVGASNVSLRNKTPMSVGSGTTIVQVFLDGEQMKGTLTRMIVKGQAAFT